MKCASHKSENKCNQFFFLKFFHQSRWTLLLSHLTGLFEVTGIGCNPSEWYLFSDSLSKSLKAVLLHNRNMDLFLPLAHSVQLKEEYCSVKILQCKALKYEEYG